MEGQMVIHTVEIDGKSVQVVALDEYEAQRRAQRLTTVWVLTTRRFYQNPKGSTDVVAVTRTRDGGMKYFDRLMATSDDYRKTPWKFYIGNVTKHVDHDGAEVTYDITEKTLWECVR